MKIKNILLSLILPIIWLVLMGSLYERNSIRSILEMDPQVSVDNPDQVIMREEWRGLYLNGDKVGDAHYTLKEGRGQINGTYEMENESNISILVGGTRQNVKMSGVTALDSDLLLTGFSFTLSASGQNTSVKGKIIRNKLRLDITGLGGTSSKTIPITQRPYSADAIYLFLLKKGFPIGTKFQLPIFDPGTLGSTEIELEVMGKEPVTINGTNRDAFKVEERYKGLTQTAWISPKGEVLKESASIAGFTFISVSEPKDIAMAPVKNQNNMQDLLFATSVDLIGEIPDPRKTTELKLKLYGVSPKNFKTSDDRQKLILPEDTTQDYVSLDIQSKDLSAPVIKKPGEMQDFTPYLAPSPLIQSDDSTLRQQALKIVGQGTNRVVAVQKLADWVHKNMRQQLMISIPSAKDILKDPRGDCKVHSTLFAGLARSIGIPTKMDVGIVYANGGFFYHAWNEVWVGQWVPIDCTFGQTRVDATHIKLFEGDLDQAILLTQYLGKMKVEVLKSDTKT
jgi:hypothetical protein